MTLWIKKLEEIDRKVITDFTVAGGEQAIDLYVDYIADKVDEIVSAYNNLTDVVEGIYNNLEDVRERLRNI